MLLGNCCCLNLLGKSCWGKAARENLQEKSWWGKAAGEKLLGKSCWGWRTTDLTVKLKLISEYCLPTVYKPTASGIFRNLNLGLSLCTKQKAIVFFSTWIRNIIWLLFNKIHNTSNYFFSLFILVAAVLCLRGRVRVFSR